MITTEATQQVVPNLTSSQILRSVNIVFDADHPERIAHFFPTTKSIELLRKLLSEDDTNARFVVAPYGSGKSLVASFYQHIVENRSTAIDALRPVIEQIGELDDELFQAIQERTADDQIIRRRGIVVSLVGYVKNLPEAFKEGVIDSLERIGDDASDILQVVSEARCETLDDLIDLLTLLRDRFAGNRIDTISLLWDEFGRHLEQIILQGEARRLNELQVVAEFAARTKKLRTKISLFLHQGLMRYASNVPQAVIQEWKKIEGRFHQVQFVDDSKEVLVLAARVLNSRFPDQQPNKTELKNQHAHIRETGMYAEFSDDELKDIIQQAWPLLPSALYVLPRISSRVAQNERTLFSFLFAVESGTTTCAADVFDYFSDLMRADSSFGGTYHHWLETQTALSKVEAEIDVRIVKTLCLFGLGLSGERTRVSRKLLSVAACQDEEPIVVFGALEKLIQRKLLLYRRNADTVLLWHATDIDLRGKLESEKIRASHGFDLLTHLNSFLPPEDWRPVEYNSEQRMLRFSLGRYVSLEDLSYEACDDGGYAALNSRSDGVVDYFLPETDEDIEAAVRLMRTMPLEKRIVVLIPRSVEGLHDTALEAAAIHRLLSDGALAAEDPLVVPELQQMLDDSQAYLTRVLERMYSPSPVGPRVFSARREIEVRTRREFRSFLSVQMHDVFSLTPVLNNELVNKMNPSQVVRNARKKLVLGILDRYGTEDLGVQPTRPDGSMFRTLLVDSGLYLTNEESWQSRFRRPHELTDPALRNMWGVFEDFFTARDARDEERDFQTLFDTLLAPPIGVRAGVIPILLAAAFRAFPAALSIIDKSGEYIRDILPSTIENICSSPQDYKVTVVALGADVREYLSDVEDVFALPGNDGFIETDPLRRCFDAIEAWKAILPTAALASRKISQPARVFQRLLVNSKDPAQLLLRSVFERYGKTFEERTEMVAHIRAWKEELEAVVNQYVEAASRSVLSALEMERFASLRDAGKQWVQLLPADNEAAANTGMSAALVQRFSMPYEDDIKLLDSVSTLLLGKRLAKWDDSTITQFDREFKNAVRQVEDDAVGAIQHGTTDGTAAADLLRSRISGLYRKLESIVGKEQAQRLLLETVAKEE